MDDLLEECTYLGDSEQLVETALHEEQLGLVIIYYLVWLLAPILIRLHVYAHRLLERSNTKLNLLAKPPCQWSEKSHRDLLKRIEFQHQDLAAERVGFLHESNLLEQPSGYGSTQSDLVKARNVLGRPLCYVVKSKLSLARPELVDVVAGGSPTEV